MSTQLTTTDYQALAKQAADYITFNCNGINDGFEVTDNGYIAFINYEAEYKDAIGGSYEGREFEPIAELVKETVTVAAVWDQDGNEYPEIAKALQLMLN